jgi:hypothetical protein
MQSIATSNMESSHCLAGASKEISRNMTTLCTGARGQLSIPHFQDKQCGDAKDATSTWAGFLTTDHFLIHEGRELRSPFLAVYFVQLGSQWKYLYKKLHAGNFEGE